MHTAIVKVIAVALGVAVAGTSSARAAPVIPAATSGSSDLLFVAKKKKKVASRGPILLGRVEDIDRRERNATNRRGGKVVGRVPGRNRNGDAEAFNAFMLGMAGVALGAAVGGYGRSGGCGIDVTTANPTSCGGRMGNNGGSNGLRPPYQCIVNGRTITTNTFRSGCWMVRQNNLAIPMGR